MDLTRTTIKLFVAKTGTAVISFLGIVLFVRILDPSQMGVFFLFQAVLGVLHVPVDFGIGRATEKRISEGETPGTVLSTGLVLKLVPLSITIAAIALTADVTNSYIGVDVTSFLVVGVVLQEVSKFSKNVLNGELRVAETASLRLSYIAVWVVSGLLFVHLGFGVQGLILGTLAGLATAGVWGVYKISTPLGRPTTDAVRSLFSYSKYDVVYATGGEAYNWLDVLIIGLFLSKAHVSAYELAWRLSWMVLLLAQSVGTTIFPQVSRWDANRARDAIEELIPEAIVPSLYLTIPAVFGAALFAREILSFVFEPAYAIAASAFVVLAVERTFHSVHIVLSKSIQGIDRPDYAAKAQVVSLGVNLALNVVLVWYFGLVGAAVGTTVAFLTNLAMTSHYLRRSLSFSFPWLETKYCFLASAGMAGLLAVVDQVVAIESEPQLAAVIGFGVVIYGLLSLGFGPLRTRIVRIVDRSLPNDL